MMPVKIFLIIFFCFLNYQSDGQIKERYMAMYDMTKKGKAIISFKSGFNKQGKPIKSIQKKMYGDFEIDESIYTYDSIGRKIKLVINSRAKEKPDKKWEYNYIYTSYGYDEIEAGKEGRKKYYVDKNDKDLKREDYNKDGLLVWIKKYEYDNKGRLLKAEGKSTSDTNFYDLHKYTYVDSTNQLLEHTEEFNPIVVKDYISDLNVKGNTVKRVCISDNTTEIYLYDKFYNQIEMRVYNSNNEFITDFKTKNKYWK